jgi:deoxyribonuclease (pyrimidine dimer)
MRCNVGINPIYLADQHLVAEFRELPIVLGQMKHLKFQFKSTIPEQFTLGTGHISFFRNKLGYLHNRWNKIKNEMKRRGFKTHLNFDIPIGV